MSTLETALAPHSDHHDEHPDDHGAAASARATSQLTWAMIFCFVFMIAEVVGGYYARSLAIMTDAAHLLSDVLAFLISLFAIWIARRPAGGALTWGSHRYEMVGAVLSVVLIWILTVVLCMEAVDRILRPEEVDGRVMFVTALLGLLVNLGMMKILHQDVGGHGGHSHSHGGHSHGSHENLNVSAAFIHVVGDLVQSIGVMIAAAVIWAQPALTIVDPICTFVFSILVLFTTYGVMRAALTSALGSAPAHVSLPALARDLQALPGVRALYGLHVWEYGGAGDKGRVALEAHLVVDSGSAMAGALAGALGVCGAHGITHPTVQVEPAGARGGVSDAAGASLEVYEEGRAPADTLVADLVAAVTGWRWGSAGRAQRAGMLYRLVPPASQLGAVGGAAAVAGGGSAACSGGHGHSHGEAAGHGHSHGSEAASHGHSHGGSGGGGAAAPAASASFGGGHSHSHPALSLSFK